MMKVNMLSIMLLMLVASTAWAASSDQGNTSNRFHALSGVTTPTAMTDQELARVEGQGVFVEIPLEYFVGGGTLGASFGRTFTYLYVQNGSHRQVVGADLVGFPRTLLGPPYAAVKHCGGITCF
jgi:hypothetical protein